MKALFFWKSCFFLMLVSCCTSKTKNNADQAALIRAIKLKAAVPIGIVNGKVEFFMDSTILYFYKNLICYEQSTTYIKQTVGFNKTNDTIVPLHEVSEIRKKYIIANKDSLYGYCFETINSTISKRVSIDSIKRRSQLLFAFNDFYEQTTKGNEIFIGSVLDEKGGLVEKYVPKLKFNDSFEDSAFYYYMPKGMGNEISFSLSRPLDSSKNRKLYKFRALTLGNPTSADESKTIDREFTIEFNKTEVTNEGLIRNLFLAFEKLH